MAVKKKTKAPPEQRYKNIHGKAINVNLIKREPDEEFKDFATDELNNLVGAKYLEELIDE